MDAQSDVETVMEPMGGPALVPDEASDAANLRRSATRGGISLVGSRLGSQFITWFVTVQVARILSPFDYGVLATGGVVLGFGDLLAEAGIGRAFVRKLTLTEDDQAEGFTISLILSVALYAILFAIAGPIAAWLSNPDLVGYLRVAGLLLLLVPVRTLPMAILERRLHLGQLSVYQVASLLIQSALILTLALTGFGFWSMVIGTLIGRCVESVALMRVTAWRPRLRLPGSSARELLTFGVHIMSASILFYAYKSSDFAVLSRISTPVILGYYSIAHQITSIPVDRLCSGFNQAVYPLLCRVQHDREQVREWYLRLAALLSAVALPAYVGLALVAPDLVAVLLGTKWMPAVVPMQLLCLNGLASIFSATLFTVFAALGRPDIATRFNTACVLILPASFWWFGQRYGVVGVALVWVVVFPLMNAIIFAIYRDIIGVRFRDLIRSQAPVFAAAILMAATVEAAHLLLSGNRHSGLRLGACILVGVISYAVSLYGLARHSIIRDIHTIRRDLGIFKNR